MSKRRFLAALSLLPSLTACGGGWHHGTDGGWGNMMYYGYGGGMFMGMLIFLILIVGIVYFVVMGTKSKGQTGVPDEKPLDILKKRYAKGEITKDEYDRTRKDLES